jgi:uncharacterized membrane protein
VIKSKKIIGPLIEHAKRTKEKKLVAEPNPDTILTLSMVTRTPADRGTKVTTRVSVSVGLLCGCMNVISNKIMSIVPWKFVNTSTDFQKI